MDAGMDEAVLIMMNSTQRNKTDWEKVMEHMKLKEIIPGLKKRNGIDGRTRDIEAEMLGVSRGQVSIYNTIGTRLDVELMQLFKDGGIGISLAHAAAQIEPELQRCLAGIAKEKGGFDEEDIRMLTDSHPMDGQQVFEIDRDVNVPDSDTFEEPEPAGIKTPDTEGQCGAGKKNAPPTDEEIIGLYRHMVEEHDGDRQNLAGILKEKLGRRYTGLHCSEYSYSFSPKGVKIGDSDYTMSYAELVRRLNVLVPVKGNVPESGTSGEAQADASADGKNVPDSGTCSETLAAADDENKGQAIKLREGYGLNMVRSQINKYERYLEMAQQGNRTTLVCECNCLLDALDLLRERLVEESDI